MGVSNQNDKGTDGWQEKFITMVEAFSNVAFYTMAIFVLIVPPLKSITDFFEGIIYASLMFRTCENTE